MVIERTKKVSWVDKAQSLADLISKDYDNAPVGARMKKTTLIKKYNIPHVSSFLVWDTLISTGKYRLIRSGLERI